MRVLIGCECSGIVRNAFRAIGHDAWSCDLIESEDHSYYHLQCDVLEVLDKEWDLAIFHPPCTHLAVSGARWFKYKTAEQEAALAFVLALLDAKIPRIAMENPVGIISTRIRQPDQIVQPWQFGHDASKKTCLWLKNLPKLTPTKIIHPHYACKCGCRFDYSLGKYGCPNCLGDYIAKLVYANQTPSGQNNLSPSPDRATIRSRTYQGIAEAMAQQWGDSAWPTETMNSTNH